MKKIKIIVFVFVLLFNCKAPTITSIDKEGIISEEVEETDVETETLIIECNENKKCPDGTICIDSVCKEKICKTSEVECYMGLKKVCDETGTEIILQSCPAGEVCKGNKCVKNKGYVYIVVGNNSYTYPPCYMVWGFQSCKTYPCYCFFPKEPSCSTPFEISTEIYNEFKELNPECKDHYGCVNPEYESCVKIHMPIVIVKYWIRRVIEALGNIESIRVAMLHEPQEEGISFNTKSECKNYLKCQNGYYKCPNDLGTPCTLPSFIEFLTENEKYKYCYAKNLCITMFNDLPNVPDDEEGFFLKNLHMILSGHVGSKKDDLLKWVDGKEELIETGEDCSSDNDCKKGFCLENKCKTHSNPEIVAREATDYMSETPIIFYASQYIRLFGREEGKKCKTDNDCINPDYICERGRCTDEARFCRKHHIVFLENPINSPLLGFEYSKYTHWMRYGWFCIDDKQCFGGAKCEVPALIDGLKICKKDYYENNVIHNNCRIAGISPIPPYLMDRLGDPIIVTTHSIVSVSPLPEVYSPNWTASCGGGKILYGENIKKKQNPSDGLKQQFNEIINTIKNDIQNSVCTSENIPERYLIKKK